jgi:hypothetical protein
MMSTALQMQGRFSAIADISTAYITVSTDYIRPAINEMKSLSTMTFGMANQKPGVHPEMRQVHDRYWQRGTENKRKRGKEHEPPYQCSSTPGH